MFRNVGIIYTWLETAGQISLCAKKKKKKSTRISRDPFLCLRTQMDGIGRVKEGHFSWRSNNTKKILEKEKKVNCYVYFNICVQMQ